MDRFILGLELLRDPDIPRGFGHRNGLAGLACWRWTVACRTAHMSSTMVRGPTRWMAAASLVLAAAPASLTYQIYDNQRQFVHLTQGSHDYPHYRLLIAGGVALTAGLVLAAVGFWILGAALRVPTDEAVIDHREGASTG